MHTEPVPIAKPADAAPDDVPADIRARVQTLRAELLAHNRAYYEEDAPTVEDSVYDGLFLELQQLEARWPALLTHPAGGFGPLGRFWHRHAPGAHALAVQRLQRG